MFEVGQIVEHGLIPEMGRARVERATKDEVQLRIHRGTGGGLKTFKLPNAELRLSSNQTQEGFDPPRAGSGKTKTPAPKRAVASWGFDAAMDRFKAAYPAGFADPKYATEERDYKQAALQAWRDGFGPDGLATLRQGPIEVAKAFTRSTA